MRWRASPVSSFCCRNQAVLAAFSSDPEMARAFTATLARQVMTLRTRLENRNLRTARERVLHYLGLQASGIDRVVRVSGNLKAVASELGLTDESLYRTLAVLEAEGTIERRRGEIRLSNPERYDRGHMGREGRTVTSGASPTPELPLTATRTTFLALLLAASSSAGIRPSTSMRPRRRPMPALRRGP